MIPDHDYDVVLIGAGCAGLFASQELAARKLRCLLLDRFPIAGFSSTTNQGWLQSGALYAGLGQDEVALACKEGSEILRRLHPDAVSEECLGYFMFDEAADCANFQARCARVGIDHADANGPANIPERLLVGTRFRHAVSVRDRPFDSNLILTRAAEEATRRGVLIHSYDDNLMPSLEKRDDGWNVRYGASLVSSQAVVVSAGAGMKTILKSVGSTSEFSTTKVAVASLDFEISKSLLAVPATGSTEKAPNIVPFRVGGRAGVTISLSKGDESTHDPTDRVVGPADAAKIADQLEYWYPETAALLAGREVRANLYACQKIECGVGRSGHRKHILVNHQIAEGRSELQGLFSFYPGKFTASPVVARDCAEVVSKQFDLESMKDRVLPAVELTVQVATQKFLNPGEYVLRVDGRRLKFEKA